MGLWVRGCRGNLSLLIAVNWNRKKQKPKKTEITVATDTFPQVFPVYFREAILELEGRKNIYSKYDKLPTYGIRA